MRFLKIIQYIVPFLVFVSIFNCSKDSKKITSPAEKPEYSLVFDHGDGELCYYPRVSSNGRYLAIEREEIVSPPGYVSHIWLHDINTGETHQLTSNPDDGYYDDRNLRFSDDDSKIYFLRTHWRLNGTYKRTLCRIAFEGSEKNAEQLLDGGMSIYCFDLLPHESRLLIAYYNLVNLEYHTGFLNLETSSITQLTHLAGQRHNCLVPLPDGSGFIASSGLAGSDLFSYKLTRHNFNAKPSEHLDWPSLEYLVWELSIDKKGNRLIVHQGVCNKSLTHSVSLEGGSADRLLTEYWLPRDAFWGPDDYIYFTVYGNVMRYGPLD